MNRKYFLVFLMIFTCFAVGTRSDLFADDDHHDEQKEKQEHEEEESGSSIGPGKAITAANKKDGIQLSEKAIKTLGVKTLVVESKTAHKFPLKSLVRFQDELGIYRLRKGWIKLIEIHNSSKSSTEVSFKSDEIEPGDHIVTDGVALLRVAELEAWGGSGDGHGH